MWGESQRKAFHALKDMAARKLFNTHFDSGKECELWVDSSGKDSICAILIQDCNMVTCFSRALSAGERKWHITEKEMFAVKYGLKKLRHFLLGRVTAVWTDHKPLIGIFRKSTHDNQRLMGMKVS